MRAFPALWALSLRECRRFIRQRSRVVGALLTPLLFWVLIGSGLGTSFRDSSGSGASDYLEYFFPGMLVLSVLFTAIFSTISVIEDRQAGFMQSLLLSALPRWVILAAKIFGATALALLQAALLMLLAPFVGFDLALPMYLGALLVLAVMAASMTTLGFYFAWVLNSTQGYHGIMNTVLMPMWILSGAVFPMEGSQAWVQFLLKLNPLSYAVTSLQEIFWQGASMSTYIALWPLLAFAVFFAVIIPWRKRARA